MQVTKDLIHDIHPSNLLYQPKTEVQAFDNVHEFQLFLQKAPQKEYNSKNKLFLKEVAHGTKVSEAKVKLIRNEVRNNLIKRGIITGAIYEGYKYDVEGEIVDHAKLAAGLPDCMLKPIKKYDKWFYELYINMSIPYYVDENRITDGAIRLIETIKALEERNIQIKVNVVLYSQGMFRGHPDYKNYLFILPVCSHEVYKDYKSLLPYCSGNFLRGPMFTVMHDRNDKVDNGLGLATKLDNTVNLWELKDAGELAERVLKDLDMDIHAAS